MDYRRKDKNMSKEICREIISVIWVKRRVVWVSWWQWNWRELGRIRIPFESTINQFSSVAQSCLTLCDPVTAAHQASLSITNSWSLLKLISVQSVMPFKHLILGHPLLLPPSVIPSIRVFSNESALHMRWPKGWSFSFSISPSNEYSGLISFRMDWCNLLAVQGTLKSLLQHHSSKASILQCSAFFIVQLSHYTITSSTINRSCY